MLAQEITSTYGDRVQFRVEDLGASPIGNRFGIDKYPAVFVDDALVARPEDFYAWGGPETGKYVPWKELANRRRFQQDLKRLIDLRLAGGEIHSVTSPASVEKRVVLPSVLLTDINGRTFHFSDLRGRKVIVEVWATWCPICLDTMRWLETDGPKDARVVAVTVASEKKDVEKVIAALHSSARVVMASPELETALNGPPAIPTLLIADEKGVVVKTFYGAPRDMHQQIAALIAKR